MPGYTPLSLPKSEQPWLTVLIDVEEEFDWSKPFDRLNTGATAIGELGRGIDMLSSLGVVPIGVMSYPVVADEPAAAILRGFVQDGRMQPGTHLHPWVCPPHEEEVTDSHSFPGNLDRGLQARKVAALGQAIEHAVGTAPRVYQAGRYGVGPDSFSVLEEAGYLVDMSWSPPYDYRPQGGPDFSKTSNDPMWVGQQLLELPVTGAFIGFLGGAAPGAFRLAGAPALSFARLGAVLARTGAAERIRLSPEGYQLADMQRLTRELFDRGLRVFNMSFHSPTLVPGHTDYVRNESDRDIFIARIRAYIEWFQQELGGRATTPLDLHAELLARDPARAAASGPADRGQEDSIVVAEGDRAPRTVLGISPLDKDATVSLVRDGKVLFAAAEERFSRQKQHAGFPEHALAAALAATGLSPKDIDLVAYPFLDADTEGRLMADALAGEAADRKRSATPDPSRAIAAAERRVPVRGSPIHGLQSPNQRMDKGPLKMAAYRLLGATPAASMGAARRASRRWMKAALAEHRKWQEELEQHLAKAGITAKLQRSEHHISHAANAYLASGFERALIVTLDGYGSGLAGSISLGENGRIKRLHGLRFPYSLGSFYEMVTSSLGFSPDRHAGKIVGLAAYGDPQLLADVLLERFDFSDGDLKMHEALNVYFSRHLASRFPMVDVAAVWQHVLEVAARAVVSHWLAETGADALVLSGGVVANVKMNQRLHELEGVERLFVYPNMGDGGCGTGLAMLLSRQGGVGEPFASAYLGPEYSHAEMRSALDEAGLAYTEPQQLAADVARRVHDGAVVARFDGRMEYGPRALGNRSILYHAREASVNQWLNRRLGRTEFMPFAPVTLWEKREQCYLGLAGAERAAEFMTVTFDCTDWMKQNCPAAVHVDGTARPQLIRREMNPGYYDILAEYEKLSGNPCLINTSFNMHEEPIVCSPKDAIRAFLLGRVDALVLGPFLVDHPDGDATSGGSPDA